jgi:hypothetical protein
MSSDTGNQRGLEQVAGRSSPEADPPFEPASDDLIDPEIVDAELVGGHAAPGLLVHVGLMSESRFGLRVAECDAPGAPARWGPVHPVHAPGSLHYAHRAADISGPEAQMHKFAAWVGQTHGPQLAELIHNPGSSVKNGGRVDPSFWGAATWAAHRNHVHVAF